MTAAVTQTTATDRPISVTSAFWLLMFLGVSALGGGLALTFGSLDGGVVLPAEWLQAVPVVDSWLLPGLVLGIGFGVGSLLAGYGLWRQPRWHWASLIEDSTEHHWSWLATIMIGLGQVAWIGLELLFLPELSWLQALYGPIGLALFLLPFTASMRDHLVVR